MILEAGWQDTGLGPAASFFFSALIVTWTLCTVPVMTPLYTRTLSVSNIFYRIILFPFLHLTDGFIVSLTGIKRVICDGITPMAQTYISESKVQASKTTVNSLNLEHVCFLSKRQQF